MKTLTQPAEEPVIVNDEPSWNRMIDKVSEAEGPIAIDVERAQSFRYSDKAYLVQIKKDGAGIFLIDPISFEHGKIADFSELNEAIGDSQWILHAATQDLPNLWQLNMRPASLFDTELAGRLLGYEKVNLAAMIEHYFDLHLEKQHSADDWSTRPIPQDWIAYAALDVELLIDLRKKMIVDLEDAGKEEWAKQEFAHLVYWADHHEPKCADERWRRTSGLQDVHTRRGMALVRELYEQRDKIARELDKSPHKVLIDKAITEIASQASEESVPTISKLRRVMGFRRREPRKHMSAWENALDTVAGLDKSDLPQLRVHKSGIPKPRNWQRINPEAAERWNRIRPKIIEKAQTLNLPVENLVSPAALREALWQPSEDMESQLTDLGVRPWQRQEILEIIQSGLSA